MIYQVMVGARDIPQAKQFYNAVLGVLGIGEPVEFTTKSGHDRIFYFHNGFTFTVTKPINDEPPSAGNGCTISFLCDSPEQVKEFHDVAVANGATSIESPPGVRHSMLGDIYACYFRDLNGHKIAGVHIPDELKGKEREWCEGNKV